MRHNPRCRRSSVVLRRSQTREQASAFVLNPSFFRSSRSQYPPEFQVLLSVFLDRGVVLWKRLLGGKYGAGSNVHRRVAFVFRFFPTSR